VRLGVLTGGGDCPGLNAVIRAAVRKSTRDFGDEVVGFLDGWRGVLEQRWVPLDDARCEGTLTRGGTILGTSRTNPFARDDGVSLVRSAMEAASLDAIIAIGGEDTLGVAARLSREGLAMVGVPKTIDNDLPGTELTFGFLTAVQTATDAIDRLQTTAESHHRVIVCEVMGRHAGWIASYAGIAGGAAAVLVPERPFDLDELCQSLLARHERGLWSSVVVVAEGAQSKDEGFVVSTGERDAFGHERLGGIATVLARAIEERTGIESRVTILGHIQRGGSPNAFDRVLATRFGIAAVEAIHDGALGVMVALQAGSIIRRPLDDALAEPKLVDPALLDVADLFGG